MRGQSAAGYQAMDGSMTPAATAPSSSAARGLGPQGRVNSERRPPESVVAIVTAISRSAVGWVCAPRTRRIVRKCLRTADNCLQCSYEAACVATESAFRSEKIGRAR
jgi:hypothetical protein